jgi:hypothetical protein
MFSQSHITVHVFAITVYVVVNPVYVFDITVYVVVNPVYVVPFQCTLLSILCTF